MTIYTPQTDETIKTEVDELSELLSKEIAKRAIHHWILKSLNADESAIEYLSTKIKELKECAEFFKNKQFPRRCLTCGSDNVIEVNLPDSYSQLMNVGIKHRCGGNIIAEMSGRIMYGELPKVIYDIYGNILHDERSR